MKKCKAATKAEEDRLIYILKGIGNTDHLAGSVAGNIAECASIGRSNRLRVAALQAFSVASCEANLQKKALEILQDHNEDAEVRIEAYLALVNCPTAELANKIAELVNNEKVNQVGGFIKSHLISIRDSTDARREYQRHYLGNIRVTKQFPKDFRRFSYNNELSYKIDALGVGASTDYKLIYSQQGFLPRAVRLNVTTEVFGTNFNVFESNIRQENLETLLEYYVGPKGIFNKDFEDVVKSFEKAGSAGGRARRSIADDANKLAKKYKTYASRNAPDVSLDLSLKLFGTELFFLSLGDNIPRTLDGIAQAFSDGFANVKQEANAYNKKFNCHHIFMDSELVYATGLGIPLELAAQGVAASIVDVGLNINIDSFMQDNWQRSKYGVKIIPSVEVQTSLHLGFNAMVLATGLRVNAQLHSATGGDVEFKFINEGNGFNVDLEVPREKIELIDFSLNTDFYTSQQGKNLKSSDLKTTKKALANPLSESCFNQLDAVGMTVCLQTSLTSLDANTDIATSWQKPLIFKLYVNTEKKFNLKGYHITKTEKGIQQWKLEYSTPNSKTSHDSSLTLELGSTPMYARISYDNPSQHFALQTGLNNDDKELVVYSQYEQNQDIKKSLIGFAKRGNEYHPIINLQDKNGVVHDIQGYTATGKIVTEKIDDLTTKYKFDNFQIVNPNKNDLITVNGWTEVGPASVQTQLKLSTASKSFSVNSGYEVQKGDMAVNVFVNNDKTPQSVYGVSARIKYTEQNYKVDLQGKAGNWLTDSSTEFKYTQAQEKIASTQLNSEVSLKNQNNVVGSGSLSLKTQGKTVDFNIKASVPQKKVSASAQFNGGEAGQYNLEVKATAKDNFINVNSKAQLHGNRYTLDNILTTSWGTSVTAKGEVGQRFTAEDVFVDLQGTAQFNSNDKLSNWIFKVIGTPDKTNSEFKLQRDNAELIKYGGEFQHPQDKVVNAKINLLVKNVLTSKIDYKIAKNGKGELNTLIETQKTEPKHKLEVNSKFLIIAPKYDIETTVLFDTNKKLYFKTENIADKAKHSFSTKNVVEVSGKKVLFDAQGSVKGEWRTNGDVQGELALTCPSGRLINASLKRKLTTNAKTGISQGNMEVKLSDKQQDGKTRSWVSTGKLEKLNTKTKEFAVNSQHVYSNFENKKFELSYQIKHLAKDANSKSFDLSLTTKGDLTSIPTDLAVKVDEYSSQHAKYQATAKAPGIVDASVKGSFKLGENAVPSTYDIKVVANLPKTEQKTFELSSKGKVLKPSNANEGQYLVEISLAEKAGTDQYVQFSTSFKGSRQQGNYNLDLKSNHLQGPMTFNGSYDRKKAVSTENDEAWTTGTENHALNFKYADKFVTSKFVSAQEQDVIDLHYTIESSFDAIKILDVTLNLNKKEIETHAANVNVRLNDLKYSLDTSIYHSAHKKGYELKAINSQSQPTEMKAILELLGERKAKLTLKIENLQELDFESVSEASYKSADDFYINSNWNSEKLKLPHYSLSAKAQAKHLTMNLKNAEGVIFDGSATYALKQENNKSILEGQGQLTYQGKAQSTNFKLIRQVYNLNTDKEIGFSYNLNGQFGPKNSVSTFKLTNKDFNIKFSICEEKKQCTNVQLQSSVNTENEELNVVRHSLLALFDLRQLGYPYEFEFKSNTVKQGLKFQYSLDSIIRSNNNLKYQLIANWQAKNSKLQINLPKREILIETQRQFPNMWTPQGHYENSIVFYFDKANKPNEFTRFVTSADIAAVESTSLLITGAVSFEHPTIRPLKISGSINANKPQSLIESEVVFDIFCKPENKLTMNAQVKNTPEENGFKLSSTANVQSLTLHYQAKANVDLNTKRHEFNALAEVSAPGKDLAASASVKANPEHIEAIVKALNEEIMHFNAKINQQKQAIKIDSVLNVLGLSSYEANIEVQPSQTSGKINLKKDNIVTISGDMKLGKDLNLKVESSGDKLLTVHFILDAANFLDSNYEINDEAINKYMASIFIFF